MMRVVAGKYKRRILSWPDDVSKIRPTKDRIREAVFSAIGDITDSVVLDLYAGSGAMGIEALSREAKSCYFVDINSVALKTIKSNLSSLNIPNNEGIILGKSDFNALEELSLQNVKFDLVILDPPYDEGRYEDIINILFKDSLLNEHAIIVCESNRDINLEKFEFKKIKDYKYGEIKVTILWR